jgi:hypothetical protein
MISILLHNFSDLKMMSVHFSICRLAHFNKIVVNWSRRQCPIRFPPQLSAPNNLICNYRNNLRPFYLSNRDTLSTLKKNQTRSFDIFIERAVFWFTLYFIVVNRLCIAQYSCVAILSFVFIIRVSCEAALAFDKCYVFNHLNMRPVHSSFRICKPINTSNARIRRIILH